jgi:hypothetical protein
MAPLITYKYSLENHYMVDLSKRIEEKITLYQLLFDPAMNMKESLIHTYELIPHEATLVIL